MAGISTENSYKTARRNMLLGQLIPHQINDPDILNAIGNVARETFLPERLRSRAYADETIFTDAKAIMFSPRITANLLLSAELHKTDFVLDVYAGTGYTSAVIAALCQAVIAIEADSSLCETAQQILIDSETDNVAVLNQNPEDGFPSQAPFDVIFVEGIVSRIPDNLLSQLAENGRLICITAKETDTTAKALKIERKKDTFFQTPLFDLDLSGFPRNRFYKSFVFETVS